MKATISRIVLFFLPALFLGGTFAMAQNQEQEPPDIEEMAEKEADRLQELLDLNDYQVFYVDSTLKHDYAAMTAEWEPLQKQRVTNSTLYIGIQDKWMEAIDNSYRKIFTDEQWELYLKNGAGKNQKARAKRKEKADKALQK